MTQVTQMTQYAVMKMDKAADDTETRGTVATTVH